MAANCPDEVAGVFRDVFAPLAQGGQLDAEDREPEIEVFAEVSGGDLLFEVAVRGGDDPQVDFRRAGLADLDEFAAFEHAQQLGLQFDGHFSDFVEKQRSLVGLFEQPLFVLRRTRETAGAVAEEFAFEQLFGEGRAVDRHECLSGARPGLVDRLREDLLARSGLAGEQYRRVRRSDFAREVHGLSERLRRTDDAVERMFVGEFRLETRQSALHPRLLRRTAQQRQDLVVVVAFGDVVECAVLDRLHAVGYVAVGGEQDDFGGGCDLLDPADQFHAVAVGEFDVAQHDVRFVLAEQPEAVVQSGACSTSYPSSPMMRASSARSWGSSSIIRIFAIAVSVLCGKGTTKFEIVDMLLRRPSRNPAVRLWGVSPVGIAMRSCRSGRPSHIRPPDPDGVTEGKSEIIPEKNLTKLLNVSKLFVYLH